MSLPTSLLAYQDCLDAMDRCLENEHGVRIRFPDHGYARFFRMRLHYARRLHREKNREIYADQPDHPMHGGSIYDPISAKLRQIDGEWYLFLVRITGMNLVIEPMSEPLPLTHEAPIQIEYQPSDSPPAQAQLLPPVKRRI